MEVGYTAKEQGPGGAEEESVFTSQASMLNDTSVSAAFSGNIFSSDIGVLLMCLYGGSMVDLKVST